MTARAVPHHDPDGNPDGDRKGVARQDAGEAHEDIGRERPHPDDRCERRREKLPHLAGKGNDHLIVRLHGRDMPQEEKERGNDEGNERKGLFFLHIERGGTVPRRKGGKKPEDGPNLSLYASLLADVREIEEDLLCILYLLALERTGKLAH